MERLVGVCEATRCEGDGLRWGWANNLSHFHHYMLTLCRGQWAILTEANVSCSYVATHYSEGSATGVSLLVGTASVSSCTRVSRQGLLCMTSL